MLQVDNLLVHCRCCSVLILMVQLNYNALLGQTHDDDTCSHSNNNNNNTQDVINKA